MNLMDLQIILGLIYYFILRFALYLNYLKVFYFHFLFRKSGKYLF